MYVCVYILLCLFKHEDKYQTVFPVAADVKQDMLETIVPKGESDSVMVVLGEHRGQVSPDQDHFPVP